MQSVNRFLWLSVLLCVAALAISSVHSLTEVNDPLADEFYDEGLENFDYDSLDESDIDSKYDTAPPPANYPPPPVSHEHHQPHHEQPHHHPEPAHYQAPKYHPVPVPVPVSTYEHGHPKSVVDVYVQPSVYHPPAANYSAPTYHQTYEPIPQTYEEPKQTYEQPKQSYEQPKQTYQNYSAPAYQQPAYPQQQPAYQQQQPAAQQQPAYQQPQPNYNNYSAPAPAPAPAPAYQQPAYQQQPAHQQSQPSYNYSAPAPAPAARPAYQPQQQQPHNYNNYSAPTYQQPAAQHQPAYTQQQPAYPQQPQPQPQPQPAYQQQQPAAQQQPAYQQPQPSYNNYSAPAPAAKPAYQHAAPASGGNYSVTPYSPTQSPGYMARKYSLADLAPYTTPFNYRANHWTLHYYRFNVYRDKCPKQMYNHGPSYKDVEEAFAYAIAQVGLVKKNVHYMDANVPSFAARHQIFSYLNQQNARMDEEALLVEMVGQYLADRLCLTKWDRQRYLPQLSKVISASRYPGGHSCSQYYHNQWQGQSKNCAQHKYRSYDGFCNNPYHPYWGKSNVCHIRLMSPDYSDGISLPRESHNPRYQLPNPRILSDNIHGDVPIDGPWNLMKMQWGQFINHDISNTALSAYDGLIDCCKQPQTRGCWPILVPNGDRFYGSHNVSCLNFIRSGACPLCQLGPRQQTNKNTAFLDASHVYGQTQEQANQLRAFVGGQLRTSGGKHGEVLLPISKSQEQCTGVCFQAGDSRVNQHPALTALHTLLLRNHNRHASALAARHPDWNDETVFQEARRLTIAEYQMINYNEYFPIVFGPILSAYFQLTPARSGYTQYNPKVDPTTWNEYTTATCRFGHSQISSVFGLYSTITAWGQPDGGQPTFRLKDWFLRPGLLSDGLTQQIVNGLLSRPSLNVDPWITNDVRNHLYQSPKDHSGGDLAATNVWRGRDHGLPGYVHYLEYCFNYKVRGWKELQLFIPNYTLNQMRKLYKVVENIDLFTGGLAERHFPGADIGPTFACVNGIQYNHLKFGDRYYFEHSNQAGSFNPAQLDEIRRSTLARLLCRTAHIPSVPQWAFLQPSQYNPLVNCSHVGDFDYSKF